MAQHEDDDQDACSFPCPHCGEDQLASSVVCRFCGYSDDYVGEGRDFDPEDADRFDDEDGEDREYSPSEYESSNASSAGFWFRMVILAIIISFFLSIGLF